MNLCKVLFASLLMGGLLVSMAGCAVGPDFAKPDLAKAFPSPTVPATVSPDERDHWWSSFGAPAMDERVARALRDSPDIQAAQEALLAAQETALAQRGAFFPAVTAGVNPTRQKTSGALSSVPADGSYVYSLHTAQLSIGYSPDLFGANRRAVESLVAQADEQRYQWQAARLTLIANLCVGLIEEASLQAQLDAIDQSVRVQQQSLEIARKRYALGDAAQSDVLLQSATLTATQAQRPAIEKQWLKQRDRNAALEGRHMVDAGERSLALSDFTLPTDLPTSVPSAWLEQRPDIQAAEAQWHAASAQVGVAVAARLPALTLSASGGSSAARFGDLFGPGTAFWNLAGDLAAPILDGGTLRHQQRSAEANNRRAAALYRSTAMNAFADVGDALHALEADRRAFDLAQAARGTALASYRIAQTQYAAGDMSLIALLTTEQAWRDAELSLITARAARLEDAVALKQSIASGSEDPARTAGKEQPHT
ncbi:NodT family efflux transporter outer membrane factor (OMF) lipoprotein [Luteibacter sp. 1214]|uniref:efflux transporter outer membrane subunit n=1 Tax=Luteibacter sp. 1214 TaxID=2817735 RepID=UPI002867028B|nr:efflux transporter outer membrane subunit [Luteibacter sp. 1214]MDR6641178.1 NodT family efflux transporter outer membrane factor (OMF) lipoprotein [Luteibacter sp. 1214]